MDLMTTPPSDLVAAPNDGVTALVSLDLTYFLRRIDVAIGDPAQV